MDFPRNCFDAALCVAGDGVFTTSLGNKDNNLALAYNISHSIESKFLDYANSYFVSNVAAGKVLKSFDESFIIPEFNRYSEYEKETLMDTEENSEQPDEITLEAVSYTHLYLHLPVKPPLSLGQIVPKSCYRSGTSFLGCSRSPSSEERSMTSL